MSLKMTRRQYAEMFGPTTGQFLADAEGLHAALVTNPSALFNNPRPGHDDDASHGRLDGDHRHRGGLAFTRRRDRRRARGNP